jgi:hypothetical protein
MHADIEAAAACVHKEHSVAQHIIVHHITIKYIIQDITIKYII